MATNAKGLGSIGKMMRKTRTAIIERTVNDSAQEFFDQFGMRDGDYVEYYRHNTRNGLLLTIGRIMSVESCYYTEGNECWARCRVAPLLQDGTIGNTHWFRLVKDKDGTVRNWFNITNDYVAKVEI